MKKQSVQAKDLLRTYTAKYTAFSSKVKSVDDELLHEPHESLRARLANAVAKTTEHLQTVKTVKRRDFEGLQASQQTLDVEGLSAAVAAQTATFKRLQQLQSAENREEYLDEYFDTVKLKNALELGKWPKALAKVISCSLKAILESEGKLLAVPPARGVFINPDTFRRDRVCLYHGADAKAFRDAALANFAGWPEDDEKELKKGAAVPERARVKEKTTAGQPKGAIARLDKHVVFPFGTEELKAQGEKVCADCSPYLVVQRRNVWRMGPEHYPATALPHLVFAPPKHEMFMALLSIDAVLDHGMKIDAVTKYLKDDENCQVFDKDAQSSSCLLRLPAGSILSVPWGMYPLPLIFNGTEKLKAHEREKEHVGYITQPLLVPEFMTDALKKKDSFAHVGLNHMLAGTAARTGVNWEAFKKFATDFANKYKS